jgi:carboxypeptidase D
MRDCANPTTAPTPSLCAAVSVGNLLNLVVSATGNSTTQMVNVYDTRLYAPDAGSSSWPPLLNNTAAYMALPSVLRALHINLSTPVVWQECNDAVGNALAGDADISVVPQLVQLLDTYKLKVMLYNGVFDLICNSVGVEQMLRLLPWSGRDAFASAPSFVWTVDGATAGFARTTANLLFVKVNGGTRTPIPKEEEGKR